MESKFTNYNSGATRQAPDLYQLYQKCVSAATNGDVYTGAKFTLKTGTSPETTIPGLKNRTYPFQVDATGFDAQGQLFGMEHAKSGIHKL
ncbi:hypothetical protein L0128_20850 [candidate division KSB1 bacterium]|nr:hypothetical protein [candidate division KSB1 bacterium]